VTPSDAAPLDFDAAQHVAQLRDHTKQQLSNKLWREGLVAATLWAEAAPDDREAQRHVALATSEANAQRALADLQSAWNNRNHFDGVAAFERIPTSSVYRADALDLVINLRTDFITKKIPVIKQLAADGKCKEHAELLVDAARVGRDVSEALVVFPCRPRPSSTIRAE
jgi:hypothetical protein